MSRALTSTRSSRPFLGVMLAGSVLLGLAAWLHGGEAEFVYGPRLWASVFAILAGIAVALWPAGQLRLLKLHRRTRRLSGPSKWLVVVGLALSTGAGLPLALWWHGGDFRPGMCDEYSYLLQSQMFSMGRLAGPAHPLPEFFTTYQVVADPWYGSIYFPGTALWMLPWTWLDRTVGTGMGDYVWPGPLLATVIGVVLTQRVVGRIAGDGLGVLAAVFVLGERLVRSIALMVMGQPVALMFGVATIYLFLRWHDAAKAGRRSAIVWALLAGTVAAWNMLVRPVDALAYAAPVLIAVALPLVVRRWNHGICWKRRSLSLVTALLPIVPLAALQIEINAQTLGEPTRTPFNWYVETHLPGTGYGFDAPRSVHFEPRNDSAHYRLSYRKFTQPNIAQHIAFSKLELTAYRLQIHTRTIVAHGGQLLWAPAALVAVWLARRKGAALLLVVPWMLAGLLYVPYGFYISQYVVPSVPSFAATLVLGLAGVTMAARRVTRSRGIASFVVVASAIALVGLSSRWWPSVERGNPEDLYPAPPIRDIDVMLANVAGEALVFITPPMPNRPREMEAVYNLDVLSPDDARVVRAHDRGDENVRLVRHYAITQPDRAVYHLDQETMTLTPLGSAESLSRDEVAAVRFEQLASPWQSAYDEIWIDLKPFNPQALRPRNDK